MTYGVCYCGGNGIELFAVVYVEGLRRDLCFLVLRWDWNWFFAVVL